MREIAFDHTIWKNVSKMVLLVCLLLSPALAQTGGQFELVWSTIDGGGGQTSGGPYILTGTIGQPDAGWAAGGDYELLGGYWAGGPLCMVKLDDFARFAEYWLKSGSGLPGDLDGDLEVNRVDLMLLVEEWLQGCPHDWPLR